MKSIFFVGVGLGVLIVGVIAWLQKSKPPTVSKEWLAEQHRWATDRSAQWEGVNSAWPWDPHGDNEAA